MTRPRSVCSACLLTYLKHVFALNLVVYDSCTGSQVLSLSPLCPVTSYAIFSLSHSPRQTVIAFTLMPSLVFAAQLPTLRKKLIRMEDFTYEIPFHILHRRDGVLNV